MTKSNLTARNLRLKCTTSVIVAEKLTHFLEYCLECSILDSRVEDIHHRLRGLCDNVPKETFIDHEISYSLHFPNNQTISLRVSRSLAQVNSN